MGFPVLAQRIHPRLGTLVSAIQSRWGAKHRKGFRIPWSQVMDVGIDVQVDLEAQTTPAWDYEKWLQDHIVKKLGG